jgi:hypothetical protein
MIRVVGIGPLPPYSAVFNNKALVQELEWERAFLPPSLFYHALLRHAVPGLAQPYLAVPSRAQPCLIYIL